MDWKKSSEAVSADSEIFDSRRVAFALLGSMLLAEFLWF